MITSFNAHAVREITGAEKKDYKNIPIQQLLDHSKYFKGDGCKDYGTWDEMHRRNDRIIYISTDNSYDAGIACYVLGPGYHEHLRKYTDEKAEQHCNQFNKHALYRGKGKGMTLTENILKLLSVPITLGISAPASFITNSYVCDKNIDPALVAESERRAEEAKKLAASKKRQEVIDTILIIIATIVGTVLFFYALRIILKSLKETLSNASKFILNHSNDNQKSGGTTSIDWGKILLVIIVIIGAIIAFNSFNQPKPSSTIIMQQPSTPEREKGFDWGGFTDVMRGLERLGNPPSSNNSDKSHTFNKICYYSCTGIIFSKNIPNTSLCPLTINRNGQTCIKQ
tara:strand:+ start:184 stop:1206 length:1023 start_codon:yes stop_codon:yes gene_type:complete